MPAEFASPTRVTRCILVTAFFLFAAGCGGKSGDGGGIKDGWPPLGSDTDKSGDKPTIDKLPFDIKSLTDGGGSDKPITDNRPSDSKPQTDGGQGSRPTPPNVDGPVLNGFLAGLV